MSLLSEKSTTINIAVIINSYNRLSLLKSALDTLLNALDTINVQAGIVIFDAGSDDGSIEHVESIIATNPLVSINLVKATEPTPFSAGCNIAIETARERYENLKYCFFYETDNFIKNPKALLAAISLMEDKANIGALGFTVENHAGGKVGFGEHFPTFFSFLLGSVMYAKVAPNINKVKQWQTHKGLSWSPFDIVYTSPLLVRFAAWQSTGGMDSENFPFSDSDLDFAWKLKKAGYHSAVLKAEGIIHDNLQQISSWSSRRTIDLHQARYKLLRRHRGEAVVLLKPLLFLRHLLEFLILSVSSLRSQRAKDSSKIRIFLMRSVFKGYSA